MYHLFEYILTKNTNKIVFYLTKTGISYHFKNYYNFIFPIFTTVFIP